MNTQRQYDENGLDALGWSEQDHQEKHDFNVEALKQLDDAQYVTFKFNDNYPDPDEDGGEEEITFSLISLFDENTCPIHEWRKSENIKMIDIIKNMPQGNPFNSYDFASFFATILEDNSNFIKKNAISYRTKQKEDVFDHFKNKSQHVILADVDITVF